MAELTDAQLAEIEARAAAASPFETAEYLAESRSGPISYDNIAALPERLRWQAIGHTLGYVDHREPANIALVAHAREDILALVAEVRRLRAAMPGRTESWVAVLLHRADLHRCAELRRATSPYDRRSEAEARQVGEEWVRRDPAQHYFLIRHTITCAMFHELVEP